MPDRLEVQDITCPAGVPVGAPVEVEVVNVFACQVVRLTIRIPPGHAGRTGIALGYGHQAVFPRTRGAFISGDDEVIVYDLSNYPPGPQWQAFVCNTDTQPHTWEVRFEVDELLVGQLPELSGPLPPAAIELAAGPLVGIG